MNNCININNQLDKPQIFLKRQNAIKNSMVLNNEQKDNESYVNSSINLYEEKKSNVNNSSNIYFKISNAEGYIFKPNEGIVSKNKPMNIEILIEPNTASVLMVK